MPSQTVSIELMMLGATAVALVAAIAIIVTMKQREKREKRNTKAISAAIVDYFRRTGVDVSVGCVPTHNGKHFTAFVESEPMKRFRLSHIIEMTLREHVDKTCGLELDKVYWRFPIKQVAEGTVEVPKESDARREHVDDYIHEGLVNYRDLPKVEVTEIPWEQFQEAAGDTIVRNDDKDDTGAGKQRGARNGEG